MSICLEKVKIPEGGGYLGQVFAGYVPLTSQSPHPIIVYSVANYRPHLSHFWPYVIVIAAVNLLFLNPCLPEFSYPKNPENLRLHFSNSTKKCNPIIVIPVVNMRPHPAAHPQ